MDLQTIHQKLKSLLESREFHLFDLSDFCVARTKGRLSVSKCSLGFNVEYYPSDDFFEGVGWLAENADEAVEMLGALAGSVYVNRQILLDEKQLRIHRNMCECIAQMWGYDPECYVCGENAYCFMTECRHSICVYCFRRSVGEFGTFTCGVCRHTVSNADRPKP